MGQGAFIKVITWAFVLLLLVGACGAIAYFTGGFTGEFKTFYITVDDKDILTSASGYQASVDNPIEVQVKYTFADEGTNGYSVKVVPNPLAGKDFDLTIDGEVYSYQAEPDLTAGFDIQYRENAFAIAPKGGLNDVISAVYPNSEISDVSDCGYENMFLLVVDSYNGESTVTLAFSIKEKVLGVELNPNHIYF